MAAMKIFRMKRQNSIPQPIRQISENVQRRKSHESGFSLNSVSSSGNGMMGSLNIPLDRASSAIQMPSILTLENTVASAPPNTNVKKVTLPDEIVVLPGTMPSTPSPVMTFGYASAAHHFRTNSDSECGASTSEVKDAEIENNFVDDENEHQIGLFFIRSLQDYKTIPIYCHQPVGEEADQFLQSIGPKHKERLKKFIDTEKPSESEHYVWINGDVNGKTTVLSLTQLENHFNNDKMKRVKWRHLSIDRITVYRYSVPIITTKFRLRVMHFLSKNYRCCILCVWCFVILFISVGIVLSVIFGSAPYGNTLSRKNGTSYMFS